MNIPILFEDEFLVGIQKPAGLVTNKSETVKEATVQDWVEEKYPNTLMPLPGQPQLPPENDFYRRGGIVHRLDKDTSGVLLIAKTPESFLAIQSQFKVRTVVKKYIALVHGKTQSQGDIHASVGRLPWNRQRFGVLAGGRDAQTSYQTQAYYRYDKEYYSLLEVTPHTGRTHQIRIHLKYANHPIVCDAFYAGRKTYRDDQLLFPRLFLHAYYIKINHPKSGEILELKSELAKELVDSLSKLEKINA